jgi:hypothetical protein
MKKALALSVLLAALAGCATGGGSTAATAADYDAVYKQAENEIKLAAKTGFLWNNTEGFLKQAEEAKKAGDFDKAVKLAKKALKEAQLAQQQAKHEANPKTLFSN